MDGEPASKTYSLLQKEKRQSEDLNDFNNIESPNTVDKSLVQALKKPAQPKTSSANPTQNNSQSQLPRGEKM